MSDQQSTTSTDDRKRSLDNTSSAESSGDGNHTPQERVESQGTKRVRQPEEILGVNEDPRRPSTRLLISRQEFSKVIGKGGSNISQVRSTCGAGTGIKGIDVDENTRVLVISGAPRQVIEAFDLISESLYQSHMQTLLNPSTFVIQMLIDNTKVGRVIGTNGANIQAIKARAGALQVRIQKDPREFSPGVSLRVLVAEGTLQAVRRVHFEVVSQFADPMYMVGAGSTSGSSGVDSSMYQLGSLSLHSSSSTAGGGDNNPYGTHAHPPQPAHPPSLAHSVGVVTHHSTPSLPFNTLVSYGLQAETVRQLGEMKQYLLRQFGLELSISLAKDESSSSNINTNANMMTNTVQHQQLQPHQQPPHQQQQGPPQYYGHPSNITSHTQPHSQPLQQGMMTHSGTVNMNSSSNNTNNMPAPVPVNTTPQWSSAAQDELSFAVSTHSVGAIIGKEGRILKDLQTEFDVKIYVEKFEIAGTRRVVIRSNTSANTATNSGSGTGAEVRVDGQSVAGIVTMALSEEDKRRIQACGNKIVTITQQQQAQHAANKT